MVLQQANKDVVAIRERIRNAWANRCLICLFHPFHGEDTDE